MERFVIVVTGAAVLCLQLVASRIMAPFFGVSLYIWTGILSITLLCLAVGYYLGGRYCHGAPAEAVETAFHRIPAVSGLALTASAILYPVSLGPLARIDLIAGTFLASIMLLAVPLVAMSALNPLLVALERDARASDGDAGAGWVFFLSTLGSVAGVIIAAFVLIPHLSSRQSIQLIAALLCVLSLAGGGVRRHLPRRARLVTAALALLGLLTVAGLQIARTSQDGPGTVHDGGGTPWTTVASYPSAFGAMKVVEIGQGSDMVRALINDGLAQNGFLADGRHAFLFTHALETVALHLVPRPRRVLGLGLGAGALAEAFALRGARVEVVEINERALPIARRHFGYRPGPETTIHVADARTFVHGCQPSYDVVFVDLFVGDGMPEHLSTHEFFDDLRRCLAPGGVLAMNSFLDTADMTYYRSLLATLVSSFGPTAFIQQDKAASRTLTNGFLFAAADPKHLSAIASLSIDHSRVPPSLAVKLVNSLGSLQVVTPDSPLLAGAPVLTDENNRALALASSSQLAFRASMVRAIPDAILAD